MMMTIVTMMMMMMMMMIDRGLMKRKIQFLMFPRTFFRLFRLIIYIRGIRPEEKHEFRTK